MTITWTSGYAIEGAQPFVQWGPKNGPRFRALAVTLTFDRSSMCGVLKSFYIALTFDYSEVPPYSTF